MNFLPFMIAKRLYVKQNKNHLILLISIFSKMGIFISTLVLVISFSALNGFKALLNQKILATLPHGIIQLNNSSHLIWHDIMEKLRTLPGISYYEPYIVANGLLIKNNSINFIELKSFSNIHYLKNKISFQGINTNLSKKKCSSDKGIIISSYLAQQLSLKKNDCIKLFILNKKKILLLICSSFLYK